MYTYRKYVDIATFQRYCSESTEPLRSLPNSYAVVCIHYSPIPSMQAPSCLCLSLSEEPVSWEQGPPQTLQETECLSQCTGPAGPHGRGRRRGGGGTGVSGVTGRVCGGDRCVRAVLTHDSSGSCQSLNLHMHTYVHIRTYVHTYCTLLICNVCMCMYVHLYGAIWEFLDCHTFVVRAYIRTIVELIVSATIDPLLSLRMFVHSTCLLNHYHSGVLYVHCITYVRTYLCILCIYIYPVTR